MKGQGLATKLKFRERLPLAGEAVERGVLTLSELPPSLNNAFVNVRQGRIKSQTYKGWLTVSQIELRTQEHWHVPGKVRLGLAFNRNKTRADLDNLIKPILDLLVTSGRMEDDRNVVDIRAAFCSDTAGVFIAIGSATVGGKVAA